jgi:monovalent cation:proton antiporter-2 (CPA2) family protein
MHGQGFLVQAFVYLAAAVISVTVAKRFGLSSVLGYLIAGMAIGPFGLGLVGEEGKDVMHFAEFGVVLMLFLIGLELQPPLLWRLRGPILGMGGVQVAVTTLVIMAIGIAVGLSWRVALAVGMTLALSSTAIVLQTLAEKGLMKTDAGQSSFAVLLFQDISVIPMLAVLPLLAVAPHAGSGHGSIEHGGGSDLTWVEGLPGWSQTLVVVAAVALIILAGRFLVRPAFRFIARTRLREIFTAAALMLVIGTALLMSKVGLSPALGTFLAGVVLANSEYRHELEGDVEPFKGLLLAVFFIAIGASIDFGLIASRPGLILGLVAALLAVKLVILFILGRAFRMGLDQNLLFTFALAQSGEFAFVLFSFAAQSRVLTAEIVSPLIAVVAVSMALTPLLMLVNERLIQPRVGTRPEEPRPADAIDEENPVIIAGFGRVGNIVGRFLRANGIGATVLEYDSDHVELLRNLGLKVFYGDACRRDLLTAAGAERARLIILTLNDHEKMLRMVEMVHKHFPHLSIMARANGRLQAYELLDAGVQHVFRDTLDSSLRLGIDALRFLGIRSHHAHRAARMFRRHDEDSVRELGQMRHDTKRYLSVARQRIQDLEKILLSEIEERGQSRDAGWDTDSLREEFGERPPESTEPV